MDGETNPRRQAILDAAFEVFTRYGFRRTSMEDIARETGVSRPSLYSHFRSKEEIFRTLSELLLEAALGEAEQALKDGGGKPVAERVEAALLAQLGRMHEVVHRSPHGEEIMDENSRLCGDLVSAYSGRLDTLLGTALRAAARAGEIDLKRAGLTAASAAELLHLSASGLKHGGVDRETFEARLHKFVPLFFQALR